MNSESPSHPPVKAALVWGDHAFDVPAFYGALRAMPQVDFYAQGLDDFCYRDARHFYDVVVFYNFHQTLPGNDARWFEKDVRPTLESLGETPQGIVLLHHALLAFRDWPHWGNIAGLPDRSSSYHGNQHVESRIVRPEHPIVAGLSDWEMTDETYKMQPAGLDSNVLIETDHPLSLSTLAWTRQFKQSRVFCYQSGHDTSAFENPNFRHIIERGTLWAARRL